MLNGPDALLGIAGLLRSGRAHSLRSTAPEVELDTELDAHFLLPDQDYFVRASDMKPALGFHKAGCDKAL